MSYANDMSLYQVIPQELHGSFFFKTIQNLLKVDGKHFENAHIRQCIFMALHVEQNFKWASKLNSSIRKCHEKINSVNSDVSMEENIEVPSSFAELFVNVAEKVEL